MFQALRKLKIQIAFLQEAANLGKKVAVLDFVKPSPIGTTWGNFFWMFKMCINFVVAWCFCFFAFLAWRFWDSYYFQCGTPTNSNTTDQDIVTWTLAFFNFLIFFFVQVLVEPASMWVASLKSSCIKQLYLDTAWRMQECLVGNLIKKVILTITLHWYFLVVAVGAL